MCNKHEFRVLNDNDLFICDTVMNGFFTLFSQVPFITWTSQTYTHNKVDESGGILYTPWLNLQPHYWGQDGDFRLNCGQEFTETLTNTGVNNNDNLTRHKTEV